MPKLPRKKPASHARPKMASLIIINFNGRDQTLEFLKSIRKTDYPNYETIVVDNASTDGSADAIRRKFPNVKIVRNPVNMGASGGKNAGIKAAKGEYLITLDNDMAVCDSEWLSELVKAAQSDEKIGLVSPILMYYDRPKVIQRMGIADGGKSMTLMESILGAGNLGGKPEGNDDEDVGQFTDVVDVKDSGAGLIKREVIDAIGGFDEKIFVYYEDSDLSIRAKRAGFRVVRAPKSRLLHKGGMTTKTGYFAYYQTYKNKLRFILKHYGPITKVTATGFNLAYYLFSMAKFLAKGRPEISRAFLDAILWNARNWKDYV
jgi:GT2 family glycosyltransferase